jgi:hypothetical protein
MAAGFPNLQNILKIGFLNEHPEELLSRYMDIYDIVLINDSTCNNNFVIYFIFLF